MDQKKRLDAYRKAEVMTANRETILLMMYAGAIRFIKQAMVAMEEKKIEEKSKFLIRAQDIVSELRANLNFNIGGDIAKNLEQLYVYVLDKLVQGNLENKPEKLNEALTVLSTLNEAWEAAIDSLKKEKANPAAAK